MADQLSTTFAALADPTRRAILARLASGECSVTELAEPFEMSHAGGLEAPARPRAAGLIARGREAQWRPCRIEAAPLKEVAEWTERYRQSGNSTSTTSRLYLQQTERTKEKNMAASGVANSETFKVTTPSDTEIHFTRLFDAPRTSCSRR
jgi:DNA-binding transcriptional ArsR family regulator